MTKEEIYESSLKMLSMSGQGVPVELLKPHLDWSLVEELIEEGKLALHPQFEGTSDINLIINDDKYYRQEVDDPKVTSIEAMRLYIGVIDENEMIPLYDATIKELLELNKEAYDKWLDKNKEKLDAIIELREELLSNGTLTLDDVSHLSVYKK